MEHCTHLSQFFCSRIWIFLLGRGFASLASFTSCAGHCRCVDRLLAAESEAIASWSCIIFGKDCPCSPEAAHPCSAEPQTTPVAQQCSVGGVRIPSHPQTLPPVTAASTTNKTNGCGVHEPVAVYTNPLQCTRAGAAITCSFPHAPLVTEPGKSCGRGAKSNHSHFLFASQLAPHSSGVNP